MNVKKKELVKKIEEMKEREQALLYSISLIVQTVMIDTGLQVSDNIQKEIFLRFNINAIASFTSKWITDYWKDIRLEEGLEKNPFVVSWLAHKDEILKIYTEELDRLKAEKLKDGKKTGNFYS